MSFWSIDLGTTNSSIARWNEEHDMPELVHIQDIARKPEENEEIDIKYCVPSCVYIPSKKTLKEIIGSLPFFLRHAFIGELALIGREAKEKESFSSSPAFVSNFKPALGRDKLFTVARFGGRRYTAKQVTLLFLRELVRHTRRVTGERPLHVTFTVPVDSFETYRLHVKDVASKLGMRKFRVVDEPVAAAMGYGLRADEEKAVLVIDFGGGTLNFALVRLETDKTEKGRCTVIAKLGLPIGGNTVDEWLLGAFIEAKGYDLARSSSDPQILWWYRIMIEEACRVKESLYFRKEAAFDLVPPSELKRFDFLLASPDAKEERSMPFTRDDLVELLEERGLYDALSAGIERVLGESSEKGIAERDIGDVLMVGGSTLLPGVYRLVEKRFGRDRVRAWQPFAAVAYGGCAFSAGRLIKADFITHDYAFLTYTLDTHEPEYTIIVPAGTPFPTKKDFWKHRVIPTCPHGEPEKIFKLVICEIGGALSLGQEFVWDEHGYLHAVKKTDAASKKPIVPLNDSNPTLGFLSPPHYPSDKTSRLDISFMVNEERWLCTTVLDLKTRKYLLEDEPVCRLK